MDKNPLLYIAVLLSLVLGGVGSFTGLVHPNYAVFEHKFGSTGEPSDVYPNPLWQSGGESVGPTGTFNQNTQFGTCNLIGTTAGITATSTANFDCAVTGVKSGDTIFGDPPATEGVGVLSDILVQKVVASTTNGFITFTLVNLTGAATTTLGSNVASSTEYFTQR